MPKFILSFIVVFFVLVPCIFAQQQMQDVVYLKDGTIIRGLIIEQIPNVSIKLKTKDGNVFVYKMEDIEKTAKEPMVGGGAGIELRGEKSPALAFVLSFILPGLGQYYNGDYTKGIVQDVVYVTGWTLVFTVGIDEKAMWEYDYWYGGYYDVDKVVTAWFWVGLGMAGGSALWSMIDAPISASNINKQRRLQGYGHLLEFNKDKYTLGLDVGPIQKGKGVGARLALHF